jgi:hypothetical protein
MGTLLSIVRGCRPAAGSPSGVRCTPRSLASALTRASRARPSTSPRPPQTLQSGPHRRPQRNAAKLVNAATGAPRARPHRRPQYWFPPAPPEKNKSLTCNGSIELGGLALRGSHEWAASTPTPCCSNSAAAILYNRARASALRRPRGAVDPRDRHPERVRLQRHQRSGGVLMQQQRRRHEMIGIEKLAAPALMHCSFENAQASNKLPN